MSKLDLLIKEGESLPLATASKAVFRYPFCGGTPPQRPRIATRMHKPRKRRFNNFHAANGAKRRIRFC